MKTILVLTDFTKAAQRAADMALIVAGKLKADILLLNSFVTVPVIPSDEAANWQVQDYFIVRDVSNDNLDKEKKRLERQLKKTFFEPGQPTIRVECDYGSVVENTKKVLGKHSVSLIMMGGREKDDMPFLFGDTIKAIINHIKRPVLVVPSKTNIEKLHNATFATDLEDVDLRALNDLGKLSKALHFNIHVAHVSEPVLVPDFREEKAVTHFRERVMALGLNNVSYHALRGDDIGDQLEKFNHSTHADLIAMVHQKHSFWWGIFNERPCQEMITHHHIPVLIYPEHH